MTAVLGKFGEWFWDSRIWLPANVTWDDVQPYEDINPTDLYYPFPMALVLLLIRYFLEKYCFMPFGLYLGVRPKRVRPVTPQPELERLYKINKQPGHKDVAAAAKLVQMTERQTARWFRLRHARDRPSKLTKFSENSFRCTYFTFAFSFGLYILWDKPWLWDINECWSSYPYQSIDDGVWWYFMISFAFIWSLVVSQFRDIKHKDFWQMFVHHIATVFLMSFSWVCNLTRIGSLVIVIHDFSDIFLEACKMAGYTKYQKVANTIFLLFLIAWTITRLGLFPFWLLRNTVIDAPPVLPGYFVFNSLLGVLQLLHIFWTYLILRIVRKSILVGKVDGDIRSFSDDTDYCSPSRSQENEIKKDT